jgi:hypothetical protein
VNKLNNPSFLFHRPDFIFRNGEQSIVNFKGTNATIYFTKNINNLTSLEKSPFGSFILEQNASDVDLTLLFEKIQDWSLTNNIAILTIRCFPEVYDKDQSAIIQRALLRSGFAVKYEDITQVIPISEKMDLNTHKKRRIRKCLALGFTFRQLGVDLLSESYSLIVESRNQKAYPITMTMKELEHMFILFPEDYLLFGVFDKSKMIATSVCIKINSKILYSFYVGDNIDYRSLSPVTLLINGVYDFCKLHQYSLLDLGMSTDKGILNKGLYAFKKSFGSFDSRKLTFEKKL